MLLVLPMVQLLPQLEKLPMLVNDLSGKTVLQVEDSGYVVKSQQGKLEIYRDDEAEGDCFISLSEPDFIEIARGELNPQIAMVSEKIDVDGKADLAMYVFNLISPLSQ